MRTHVSPARRRLSSAVVAVPVSLALSLSLAVSPFSVRLASADPSAAELTAAREMFESALADENKGDWKSALEKFRRVAAVKMSPQVRFHLGLALENTGKLVDALNEFQRAQADTNGDSKPEMQTVNTNSGKHIADLKDRIPRLVLQVPSDANATVTIDGSPVTSSLYGTPMPFDPGAHQVVAKATGRTTFEKSVTLVEKGKIVTVDVQLPVGTESAAVETTPPIKKDETPSDSGGGRGPLPFVVGGIGVAALAGGVVFHFMSTGTVKDIEDACPTHTNCPASLSDTADKGKTYNTVSNVLLGVGAVGVITGVILFIASSPGGSETKSTTSRGKPYITFGAAPTPLGFGLQGAF